MSDIFISYSRQDSEQAQLLTELLASAGLSCWIDKSGIDLATPETDEDVDSLGGLVVWLLGRVPQRGEIIAHPSGYEFEVLEADPRKIKRLRIRRGESPVSA